MFRAVLPPIIRSAYNYLQHLVFVTPLLLPAAIVEELELRGCEQGKCPEQCKCTCKNTGEHAEHTAHFYGYTVGDRWLSSVARSEDKSGFSALVVSMLASGTQVRGFKPG